MNKWNKIKIKETVLAFLTCSQWLNCRGNREVRSDVSMLRHTLVASSVHFLITSRSPRPMTVQVRYTMTSGPTSPTLFQLCHRFFYIPLQLKCKDEGDKANGVTSPPNDVIIWTEKGDSQLAWSHQFFFVFHYMNDFKDVACSLNLRWRDFFLPLQEANSSTDYSEKFDHLLEVLSTPPLFTVVRVNSLKSNVHDVCQQLQVILYEVIETGIKCPS